MQEYEYKVEFEDRNELQGVINMRAMQGWRLVGISHSESDDYYTIIFERPLEVAKYP